MNSRRLSKDFFGNYAITGRYLSRYRLLYLIVVAVVGLFEVGMIVRSLILGLSQTKYVVYFCSYIALFLACLSVFLVLLLMEKRKFSNVFLSHTGNAFAIFIMAWSAVVSSVDVISGHFPIVYLTIVVMLGGIVVVNPIIFISSSFAAGIVVLVLGKIYGPSNALSSGDFINILVFIVMSFIVGIRNYAISVSEQRANSRLHELSYIDSMTGLSNYNAYSDEIDTLEKEKGMERYSIFVLDVNCLKETNDLIGHRFGSKLIQTAASCLVEEFPDAKVYRIGGDEFAVISENVIYDCDKKRDSLRALLKYEEVESEGRKLILSLAVGCSIHEPGEEFIVAFQRADEDMYVSKKEIKKSIDIKAALKRNK